MGDLPPNACLRSAKRRPCAHAKLGGDRHTGRTRHTRHRGHGDPADGCAWQLLRRRWVTEHLCGGVWRSGTTARHLRVNIALSTLRPLQANPSRESDALGLQAAWTSVMWAMKRWGLLN